jgi:hypothetical protein
MVAPLSAGLNVTVISSPFLTRFGPVAVTPAFVRHVGRTRRQLPHLELAILVLDGDMQRAVRVRKRKLLNHAGRPLGLVQVVHTGQGMVRQHRTGRDQRQ